MQATTDLQLRLYSICPIDGKGMGVIATMPISAGTKILEEPPLATGRTVDFRQPSHVRDHVAHLSDEERPTLGSLYNAFSEEYDSGLFRTNSYGLGCNSSWEGTFDTLSRVNHSCRPNSESCWDSNRQVGTLYSLWNIQVGEELTVSYIDVAEMTHDERQSELKQRWRFDCICACCSITEVVAQNTNDQRRRFIGRLHQEMSSFPASAMYRLATMAYKYADEEGLRGSPAASISLYGYRMALRLCNVEDAKKWIARYHSEHLLGTGPSSCWTKEAFALMKKRTHRVEWNPLCSEDLFPAFSNLPSDYEDGSSSDNELFADSHGPHWCFIGEIISDASILAPAFVL